MRKALLLPLTVFISLMFLHGVLLAEEKPTANVPLFTVTCEPFPVIVTALLEPPAAELAPT